MALLNLSRWTPCKPCTPPSIHKCKPPVLTRLSLTLVVVCPARQRDSGEPPSWDNESEKPNPARRPRGRPRKVSLNNEESSSDAGEGDGVLQASSEPPGVGDGSPLNVQDHEQPAGGQQTDAGSVDEAMPKRRRGRPPKPRLPEGETPPTVASEDGTASGKRRKRRSSKRSSLSRAPRDMELRVLLIRSLKLAPKDLNPPRASWRRLTVSIQPAVLGDRVRELVLALGPHATKRIATKCPHVFLMTSTHIMAKLEDLNRRLPLPRQDLLTAVCRHPAMLGYSAEGVGNRVALLVQELDKPETFVVRMVVSQPELLGLSEATLRHRIGMLHEAASLLTKWMSELSVMAPCTLGRLLRCSDQVLQRLLFTYLRSANNGRKFSTIRNMTTICYIRNLQWNRDNPKFAEWLAEGEADRRDGLARPWSGWYRREDDVDWWEGKAPPVTLSAVGRRHRGGDWYPGDGDSDLPDVDDEPYDFGFAGGGYHEDELAAFDFDMGYSRFLEGEDDYGAGHGRERGDWEGEGPADGSTGHGEGDGAGPQAA